MSVSDRYFLEAIGTAIKLRFKKKADYNAGGLDFPDYFVFGRKSAAQFLYSKALRLVSLERKNGPASNEPVEDSYLDLIVYAAFAHAVEMMEQEKEPDTSTPDPYPIIR